MMARNCGISFFTACSAGLVRIERSSFLADAGLRSFGASFASGALSGAGLVAVLGGRKLLGDVAAGFGGADMEHALAPDFGRGTRHPIQGLRIDDDEAGEIGVHRLDGWH